MGKGGINRDIGKLQVELNLWTFSVTQGDFPQLVLSSKNSKDVGVTCLLKCFPMLSIPLAAEERCVDEKEGKLFSEPWLKGKLSFRQW